MMQETENGSGHIEQIGQKGDDPIECISLTSHASNKKMQIMNDRGNTSQANSQENLVSSPDLTLQDFLTDWFQGVAQPRLQPRINHSYRELLDLHLLPELGMISLRNLQPQHLQQFYRQRHAEGYSAQVIEDLHYILHWAFTTALSSHLVEKNICDTMESIGETQQVIQANVPPLDVERVCRILLRIATYFEEKDHEKLSFQQQ